jgi:peroxiredoxin
MKLFAALALSAVVATLSPVTGSADNSVKQTIKAVDGMQMAPDLVLNDLDDTRRNLADYRGKVVAVNFWATWCPPCRHELPSMERAYKAYRDRGFVILGVNVGENWETVAPFLEDFALTYPVLLDKDSSAMSQWGIMGLPTTFILDTEGRITHSITGGRDWDDAGFRKHLEEIIARDGGR